jgi:hypothetical protein
MGKRTPIRPDYTASLATMIAANVRCRAMCDTCNGWRDLDLAALAAKIELKVYRTPIGFHDALVAAASQKAALEAWKRRQPVCARHRRGGDRR